MNFACSASLTSFYVASMIIPACELMFHPFLSYDGMITNALYPDRLSCFVSMLFHDSFV